MQRRHGRRLAAIAVSSTVAVGTALAVPATATATAAATGPATVRVSVGAHGAQGNGESFAPSITPDGRYVAFQSAASNLVAGDRNNAWDVFVRDTRTGATRRVSVPFGRGDTNGPSSGASISANGRYVAFESSASNLVASDTNRDTDVFVRDLVRGVTTRVSVGISGSGRSGGGETPSISANGRRVAFESAASDIVAHDTNRFADVFVRDLTTYKTTRVSVGPRGVQANRPPSAVLPARGEFSFQPAISGDGASVAFTSYSTNLVRRDTNRLSDVFVHNLTTHVTSRVSLATGGKQVNTGVAGRGSFAPTISANGRVVAFVSASYTLVPQRKPVHTLDGYVVNLDTHVTRLAERTLNGRPGQSGTIDPAISPDGRFVVFRSDDGNLVPADTNGLGDVFVRDLKTNKTVRVSVKSTGRQVTTNEGTEDVSRSVASSGAAVVAFESSATDLVPNDTNHQPDVFTHRR
jgi:Tol biopolymer transport system component